MRLIILLFLFVYFPVCAQQKMEFTYRVTAVKKLFEPLNDTTKILKPYLDLMEAQLEDLTYTLRTKGKESYWFLQGADTYPNHHMGKATGGGNSYYFDGNNYIEQREFLQNYFIVESPPKIFNWELLNDTREILGYTCKKAISKETKLIKGKYKTFEATAWYCPELKYKIGPQDFCGLDGLILELTDKGRKFYCTEIDASEKRPMFVMAKPSKGKRVTEEQFLKEMDRIAEEKGLPTTKR